MGWNLEAWERYRRTSQAFGLLWFVAYLASRSFGMPVWTQVATVLAALCSFVLVDKYLRRRFVESGVPTEAQLIAFDAFWAANRRFICAAMPVAIILVGSLIASNAGVPLPGWLMTVVLLMGFGAMLLTIGVGRKQKRFVETLVHPDESVQHTGRADESLSDPA